MNKFKNGISVEGPRRSASSGGPFPIWEALQNGPGLMKACVESVANRISPTLCAVVDFPDPEGPATPTTKSAWPLCNLLTGLINCGRRPDHLLRCPETPNSLSHPFVEIILPRLAVIRR